MPILQLIDKHRSLIKDREDLATTSQDASRLLTKGVKGEKRDPTRLLREEKMRKRIAKDLPKVEAEVVRTLDDWEVEYGRPFLVFGERYLDVIAEAAAKKPPPRSKTPNGMGPPPKPAKTPTSSAALPKQQTQQPASTLRSKTPTAGATVGRNPPPSSTKPNGTLKSPSKIPARVPLGNHNGNSPERSQQRPPTSMSQNENGNATMRKLGMAPPPKMRDLYTQPGSETPMSGYQPSDVSRSGSVVRQVTPEDPYREPYYHHQQQQHHFDRSVQHFSQSQHSHHQQYPPQSRGGSATPLAHDRTPYQYQHQTQNYHPQMAPPPLPQHHNYAQSTASTAPSTAPSQSDAFSTRQISADSSNGGTISGSENWETYASEEDEPELDGRDAYYAKLRATRQSPGPAGSLRSKRGMEGGAEDGRGKMMRGFDGGAVGRGGSWTTDEG